MVRVVAGDIVASAQARTGMGTVKMARKRCLQEAS